MESRFTRGRILPLLLKFALPVLGALVLQAMYGAVDLLVVGRFSTAAGVSAVATGSQMMHTITAVITGLSMGTTVLLGQRIGAGDAKDAGNIIGGGICLFGAMGLAVAVLVPLLAEPLCRLMRAPAEAFAQSVSYVSICAGGALFIVAYNVLGSVFRGMGDSKTPLLSVLIACVVNIFGDLFFVAVLKLGAAGAALATVIAQGLSVVLCFIIIKKKGMPFPFSKQNIRFHRDVIRRTLRLGAPIALQDLLVSISFLVLTAIVNSVGVTASAGMGVSQKICSFIMLVPSAFAQSLSAFVAQNIGAGRGDRARRAMLYGMLVSFALDCVLAWLAFFHGDLLASIFTGDSAVIAEGWSYLKAYAIDTLLVSFLFCFIGYFNGCGCTAFVMAQGLTGSFCVRIPVSWIMSRIMPVSLFRIGLATPCSTFVQIVMCVIYLQYRRKKEAAALQA